MWHHDHHDKEVVAQTNPRHSNLSLLRLFSWALPAPGARMWKQKMGWTPTSSSVAHQEVNILQAGFHTLKRADWCHTWKELTDVTPKKSWLMSHLKRADQYWCHTLKRADQCHTLKRVDMSHTEKSWLVSHYEKSWLMSFSHAVSVTTAYISCKLMDK